MKKLATRATRQLENKLWNYIGKDILDKFKPIDKIYLLKICKSRKIQIKKDRRLLEYFTYGKFLKDDPDNFEGTGTRKKVKLRMKKNKNSLKIPGISHERRASKQFNTSESKYFTG